MTEERELEAGVGEEPEESMYISYILALLCTGFLDDKSRFCDLFLD